MASSKPFEPKAGEMLRHLARRRRLELGLYRWEAATVAGLSPTALDLIERGTTVWPEAATLRKLSGALAVPTMHLEAAASESRRHRPRLPRSDRTTVHGTPGAYKRHLRNGQDACPECADWWRDCQTMYRRRRGSPAFEAAKCGTESGYRRHLHEKSPVCQPCRDAQTEYRRAYRGQKPRPAGSGYVGVYRYVAQPGRWQAVVQCTSGGKITALWTKVFDDPQAAARARDAKALDLQGDKAKLNFPREKAA